MQYNVAHLLKGPTGAERRYEVREEIRDLDPDLEPISPLVGSIKLMRTSQGILVTGKLRTTLEMTCHRCLEPMIGEVQIVCAEIEHLVLVGVLVDQGGVRILR